MLAMGPGNQPAVKVQNRKTSSFGFRTVQKPDKQRPGNPKLHRYPLTRWFCHVWLDLSVAISGSVFRVCLFTVAYGYFTANCKILTFTYCCPSQMNWPPLLL